MLSRSSKLEFGSFLVYPSPGASSELAGWKNTILHIKMDDVRQDGVRWPEHAASRLAARLPGSPLEDFFDEDSLLVPLPRSGLPQRDSLWPAKRIAESLVAHGLGQRVRAALVRRVAVRKSAGSKDRPSPEEHYASFALALPRDAGRIVLVDDVVTRGSTAMGAAWRILDNFPDADIRFFSIARVVPDLSTNTFLDIVRGTITWNGGNSLTRTP